MSEKYPIVPLRDIVIFPNVSSPLLIGRKASVKALDKVGENGYLFVVAQKDPIVEEVKDSDLYNYGTVVKVIHITNIADDTYKILVEGEYRAKVLNYSKRSGIMFAEVEPIVPEYEDDDEEIVAIVRMVKEVFEEYVSLHKKLSLVIPLSLSSLKEAEEVVNFIAAHMIIEVEKKQILLEITNTKERLKYLYKILTEEIEILQIAEKIENEVRSQIEKVKRIFS